jgi:hypothetical protein
MVKPGNRHDEVEGLYAPIAFTAFLNLKAYMIGGAIKQQYEG